MRRGVRSISTPKSTTASRRPRNSPTSPAREKFIPCTRDSEYREYIDIVLLGRDLAKSVAKKSFVRVVFNDADARDHWLSDHCPVGIELRLQ